VKIKEIRDLLEAATPGPWSTENLGGGRSDVMSHAGSLEVAEKALHANAEFIAASRDLVERLLVVAEAAKAWCNSLSTRGGLSRGDAHEALGAALATLEGA
jgi:hypothetical protein